VPSVSQWNGPATPSDHLDLRALGVEPLLAFET